MLMWFIVFRDGFGLWATVGNNDMLENIVLMLDRYQGTGWMEIRYIRRYTYADLPGL